MPTYAYACTACGHRFEAQQSFTDAALTECPECAGRLRKLFNNVGIVFKGSGFYRTDSAAAPAGGVREGRAGVEERPTARPRSDGSAGSKDVRRTDRRSASKALVGLGVVVRLRRRSSGSGKRRLQRRLTPPSTAVAARPAVHRRAGTAAPPGRRRLASVGAVTTSPARRRDRRDRRLRLLLLARRRPSRSRSRRRSGRRATRCGGRGRRAVASPSSRGTGATTASRRTG